MPQPTFAPLQGIRILSLALNLPGPAALMRCRGLGADCRKFEPPAGDPMRNYQPEAYLALHQGIAVETVDLKQPQGTRRLHEALAQCDVLLSSFRPSALARLGLDAATLAARHPRLWQVAIVGAAGAGAETPGHDLTYLAAHDLVTGTALPPTLFADMGGAMSAVEAVLGAVLAQRSGRASGGHVEVALDEAAAWLALPRRWGLTQPGGAVGGGHAGYAVYPCADGRVAVAALEPHFAARLCSAAGLPHEAQADMRAPAMRSALATWLAGQSRAQLDALAASADLPLHTLPPAG